MTSPYVRRRFLARVGLANGGGEGQACVCSLVGRLSHRVLLFFPARVGRGGGVHYESGGILTS